MKKLIMITNSYPYGQGEEFIENEIKFLSYSFDKIYIISQSNSSEITRKLPVNVIATKWNSKFDFYLFIISLLSFDFLKEIITNTNFNLYKIKYALGFIYRGNLIKKSIIKLVGDENLNKKETVLYSFWFLSGAYAISKIKGVLVATARAHRYDLYSEANNLNYQPLKKLILKNIKYLLPCSLEGEKYLKALYPKYSYKINYSYLGTLFEKRGEARNKSIILLSCSSLIEVKRIHLIIEALAIYEKSYNDKIKWYHIGSGELEEELINLAKKKLKRIEYKFWGQMKNSDVKNFYINEQIRAFINTSSSEGLPVSMMEVQSFGIPIIATNVGGVNEIVNEKTGILINSNPEPEEIANAINKIFKLDKNEYEKLSKNSFEHWDNNFNAENTYRDFIKKYLS